MPTGDEQFRDPRCYSCTFTQDFHDTVLTSLANLNAGQNGIIQRLDRLNGSVAELYRRTNSHAEKIAVLDSAGGEALQQVRSDLDRVKSNVVSLEKQDLTKAAASSGIKSVLTELKPLIYVVAGGVLFLLLSHVKELLEKWRGV